MIRTTIGPLSFSWWPSWWPVREAIAAGSALLLASGSATAQTDDRPAPEVAKPIQDNSFLIEEAYNQEPGVVQHIGVFTRERGLGAWNLSFTQEWPAPSQRHQLSYTIPVQSAGTGLGRGLGDVMLNYRYQLLGRGDSPLYVAPRLSLVVPTGDPARERGTGHAGVQINFPVSFQLSPWGVTHWNAGASVTPESRNAAGEEATTRGYAAGASFIWLLHPLLNAMFELAWTRDETVTGPDTRSASRSLFFAPGFRAALNLRSGLQIVPGFAVPIGLGPSRHERSLLAYLSFEHAFTEPRN